MKKMYKYTLDKKCCVCEKDEWITLPQGLYQRFFLLAGMLKLEQGFIDNRLVSVRYEDKELCMSCFWPLLSLEDYYDEFVNKLMQNEEARMIAKRIEGDKELCLKFAKIYFTLGKPLPRNVVEDLKASLNQPKQQTQATSTDTAEDTNNTSKA